LRETEGGGEILDAELAPRQHVKDADARGIAEHLEGVGERPERRVAGRRRFHMNI
jgi:hypothetical protein